MRFRNLLFASAVISSAACAPANTTPAPSASRGEITVEPVVNRWMGRVLQSSVVVSYENTSGRTFGTAVTIQCDAMSTGGSVIDTNHRSFFARETGPIEPGFRGTVKVPWSNETEVDSARCWISQAR